MLKRALLALCLTGCASGPVKLGFIIDKPLPRYDVVTDGATHHILCVKCQQDSISPKYAKDKNGKECLYWVCSHCGASYCTDVAQPTIQTVP